MQPPAPAQPAPTAPTTAPGAPGAPSPNVRAAGATAPEERFYAPAVLQPVAFQADRTHRGGRGPAGRWLRVAGVVAFLAAAGVSAWFALKPGSSPKAQPPVVLAPVDPTAGLPTSLSAVVRMQAESSRRTALQVVESVGSGDVAALDSAQPGYQWSDGTTPSDGPRRISVGTGADGTTVTVAVEASSHDICAFGRWTPGGTPEYVTVEHEPSCAAMSAPASGWSDRAGGAASDLPDANG